MTSKLQQWIAGQARPDQSSVTVRPIRPSDVNLLTEMHQRLSPASVYARFLQCRSPSVDELRALCFLRAERGAGLVATLQQEHEIIVGLAYYVREMYTPTLTAELGILVEDQFQGQGIGRRLWQQVHCHAQRNQVRQLRVLCAPNNHRVLHLLHTSGFACQAHMSDELIEYLVALDEGPQPTKRRADPLAQSIRIWSAASKPRPVNTGPWLRRCQP